MAFNFSPKPFYLGRVLGIPIRAHYSWLPVFVFYAWAIATGLMPSQVPGLPRYQYWIAGTVTAILLFASVLVHELAHAVMARAEEETASRRVHAFHQPDGTVGIDRSIDGPA